MSFFTPSLASLYIVLIFIRAFSSLLFSVHSTMIQPYFTRQFLRTIFSLFQSALSAVFSVLFYVSSRFTQSATAAVFLGRITTQACFTRSPLFVAILVFVYVKFSFLATCNFCTTQCISHASHGIK